MGGSATLGTHGPWGSCRKLLATERKTLDDDEDSPATPTQRMATSRALTGAAARWPPGSRLSTGYERSAGASSWMPPRRRWDWAVVSDVPAERAITTMRPSVNFSGLLGLRAVRNTFDKFGEETLIPPSQLSTAGVLLV